MSHKHLRPFIVKVSVLGYFPIYTCIAYRPTYIYIYMFIIFVLKTFKKIKYYKK